MWSFVHSHFNFLLLMSGLCCGILQFLLSHRFIDRLNFMTKKCSILNIFKSFMAYSFADTALVPSAIWWLKKFNFFQIISPIYLIKIGPGVKSQERCGVICGVWGLWAFGSEVADACAASIGYSHGSIIHNLMCILLCGYPVEVACAFVASEPEVRGCQALHMILCLSWDFEFGPILMRLIQYIYCRYKKILPIITITSANNEKQYYIIIILFLTTERHICLQILISVINSNSIKIIWLVT